jgi:FixJ family two-component response regulator
LKHVVAVVDDDTRVLESIENLLESAGHVVRSFASATALLESCPFAEIDCLITDIGMPCIDGLHLQRLAREARPGIPVIFVTGRDLTEDAIAAMEGSQGLFRKPFNGQDLLAAVNQALRR